MSSIFDIEPYASYKVSWLGRRERYEHYRAYYKGRAYDALRMLQRDPAHKLYAGTRTLFSPLRRAVRVDLAKVPAGWAMNPQEASVATIDRVAALRKLTDAEAAYARFLLYAAVAGEAALLLGGSPQEMTISALRADEVVLGKSGAEPFALVIKQQAKNGGRYLGQPYAMSGSTFEYAMVITPSAIRTYQDGALFSYDDAPAERPNPYGFIPVAFSVYQEGEDGCGEPTFAGVLELLDRVNELASLTLDTIGRNAEPKVVGTGVKNLDVSADDDTILVEDKDAKFYTIDPNLAIAETLSFIQDVRSEFKNLLPQLRIDQLGSISDLAYDTVVTLLQELGDHIISVRSQVDRAIETVERWMLGVEGDIPDDYELHRDRRWMNLTESQQLTLEAQRLSVESARQAAQAPKPTASGTPTTPKENDEPQTP